MKKIVIFLLLAFVFFLGYRFFPPPAQSKTFIPLVKISFVSAIVLPSEPEQKKAWTIPPSFPGCFPSRSSMLAYQGNTTATALARLQKDILWKSPRIVLITLGGHDLKNRFSKDEAL